MRNEVVVTVFIERIDVGVIVAALGVLVTALGVSVADSNKL